MSDKGDALAGCAFLMLIVVLCMTSCDRDDQRRRVRALETGLKAGWIEVDGIAYRCTPQPGIRIVDGQPAQLIETQPQPANAAKENKP